jgi:predicted CoA-binding protein
VGAAVYRRLKATGREVFAVNPNLPTFEGQPCWPDLRSIPGGVDGVVIATRPEITEAVVRNAVAAGVRRVWMHASGAGGSSVSQAGVALCRNAASL